MEVNEQRELTDGEVGMLINKMISGIAEEAMDRLFELIESEGCEPTCDSEGVYATGTVRRLRVVLQRLKGSGLEARMVGGRVEMPKNTVDWLVVKRMCKEFGYANARVKLVRSPGYNALVW